MVVEQKEKTKSQAVEPQDIPFILDTSEIQLSKSSKLHENCYAVGQYTLRFFEQLKYRIQNKPVKISRVNRKRRQLYIKEKFSAVRLRLILLKPFTKINHAGKTIANEIKHGYHAHGVVGALKGLFSSLLHGLLRNRNIIFTMFNYTVPIAAIIVFAFIVQYFTTLTYALAVEYDGKQIGYIKHETIYNDAQALMQGRIIYENKDDIFTAVPKYELTVVDNVSVITTADQLADKLIEASGSVISQASGLYIDEQFMGAVEDQPALQATLDGMLNKYRTKSKGQEVSFVKDVEIKTGLYPVSSIISLDTMTAQLTREVSTNKSYSVVKGDAPILIAQKNGITLSELKKLNPGIEEKLLVGQDVTIARSKPFLSVKVTEKVSYEDQIDYKSISTNDKRYNIGYHKVTQVGKKGLAKVDTEVTYIDGVRVETKEISRTILKNPVDEKVIVGGSVPRPTVSSALKSPNGIAFRWPVDGGYIVCRINGYKGHTGLDISAPAGTAVRASADGVVIYSATRGGYGKHVIIDHGNNIKTVYAHNSVLYAKVGQVVKQGDLIAGVGQTGRAYGNHLHFEIRINGKYMDPEKYIKK